VKDDAEGAGKGEERKMRLFARRRCKFKICLWRHTVEDVRGVLEKIYIYFRAGETFFFFESKLRALRRSKC